MSISSDPNRNHTTLPTYKVETCPELGRYVVAAKDFRKGEVIFEEQPIVVAPQKNSTLICPACFGTPNVECPRCQWPMCGSDCTALNQHDPECEGLRAHDATESTSGRRSEEEWIALQDTLMIYRCLVLKRNNLDKWNMLQSMETNWEQWSKSPLYKNGQELLKRLRDSYELTEFEDEEILRIIAIMDVNAYEVKMPDVNVQGCYQLASLAEHSCVPNAFKTTSSTTFKLTMRALTDIRKGSHIATSYCDVLWTTYQRQRHVQWSKFFVCRCWRCTDPTELGSYISAFICPTCPSNSNSFLTPILTAYPDVIKEDEEEEPMWKTTLKDYQCQNCSSIFPATRCESYTVTAESQLHDLDNKHYPDDSKDVNDIEDWLDRWTIRPAAKSPPSSNEVTNNTDVIMSPGRKRSKIKYSPTLLVYLHPQHALCLDACHTAFLLYSAQSTNMEELTRKNELGLHLLRATENILPGISMFRGTVMYDLAMTKSSILSNYLDDPTKTDKSLLTILAKEVVELLTESLQHLQYEPEDQPEGQLFTLGLQQLEELKSFLHEVLPDLDL